MSSFGLIGWPISHSMSPAIHNAGFKAEGLRHKYDLIPIEPAEFESGIKDILVTHQGVNVTTPYKEAIMVHLDVVSETAQRIQAVNTVYRLADGRLYGDSTDGAGFWQSSGITAGQKVVLIGVGGAARAIMASAPFDVELLVLNRRSSRFSKYQEIVQELLGVELQDLAKFSEWHNVNVVIDATSVGLNSEDTILTDAQLAALPDTTQIIDLKYGQRLPPLLQKAEQLGFKILDGKDMLLEQAILSHQAWINAEANRDSMQQAILHKTSE